jgi:protoheme IX farnesyltransferase
MENLGDLLSDYCNALKLPISLLNVFVGVAAILLAVGLRASPEMVLLTCLSGFLAAGGASSINCYVDRDLDRRMTRTRKRPIPDGRISASNILMLGFALSIVGVGLAMFFLNLLTALLIGMGIFWYILIYTLWLKPRTKWNIVIGGAAGSFSALAGWSAATGSVEIVGILVATLIFLWTPGHFWGLAIAKSSDYENGEIPMLPVVDGLTRASRYTAFSNVLLVPFTITLYVVTVNWSSISVTILVGLSIIALNARFIVANLQLSHNADEKSAWRVFKLSAGYLFIILCLIVIGHVL